MSRFAVHELKSVQPYFANLASGEKTFELRLNDRAYQKGDMLVIREWHAEQTNSASPCPYPDCTYSVYGFGHYPRHDIKLTFRVTHVLSADPRFSGLEIGYVILGLAQWDDDADA